jgi:hypothetical protein
MICAQRRGHGPFDLFRRWRSRPDVGRIRGALLGLGALRHRLSRAVRATRAPFEGSPLDGHGHGDRARLIDLNLVERTDDDSVCVPFDAGEIRMVLAYAA